jgi:hypothetical protein
MRHCMQRRQLTSLCNGLRTFIPLLYEAHWMKFLVPRVQCLGCLIGSEWLATLIANRICEKDIRMNGCPFLPSVGHSPKKGRPVRSALGPVAGLRLASSGSWPLIH